MKFCISIEEGLYMYIVGGTSVPVLSYSLCLAPYPGYSNFFFNDAWRKKTSEPGKVYHVHDSEGGRDLVRGEPGHKTSLC